ncbi:hypothetical protein INS49_007890 [Diaporthe citri]|uniref:uncharacterized protein n=1 Tax=Diaporthe citri TaxID=83186 RepID=UPI001C825F9E|nr:uncharacterized protein INS49_007890 [Diaporthe citri]KAG6362796.1 hypothetical protein INS49_007890 [Diaporthe citri]
MTANQNVLIPVKLDAFVLNDAVCQGGPGKAKIAPISQPNYTFLRLDDSYLQSDILNDVDIHTIAPNPGGHQTGADLNSRITDLGSGVRRPGRRGIYLHWTIPRIYRSGATSTEDRGKDSRGLPDFPEVPTRCSWALRTNSSQTQTHCSNVFSIVDNFCFDDKKNLYATAAKCSYSIIGWNSKSPSDIMALKKTKEGWQTRQQRFQELNVKIKGFQKFPEPMAEYPKEIADWFAASTEAAQTETRAVCHGAMYDVTWDFNKAPDNVQADQYAHLLGGQQPVAIGTTPMDALMAYAGAHEKVDKDTPKGQVEAALKRLEAILLSRDDGVESHVQASDLMYNWNFARFDGGDQYHAAASGDKATGEKPALPEDKQDDLVELNRYCRLRDAAKRRLKAGRLAVFSNWWLAVTKAQKDADSRHEVDRLVEEIQVLSKTVDDFDRIIEDKSGNDPQHPNKVKDFECGVHPPFAQQRDPTLLVGGVRSGWEIDYLLALLVRLDCQVMKPATVGDDAPWAAFFKNVVDAKLPSWMQESTKNLLREFMLLRDRRQDSDDGHPDEPSELAERGLIDGSMLPLRELGETVTRPPLQSEIPLFHDRLGRDIKGEKVWRDDWNGTQPWFPLFLEWETQYVHVSHNDWEMSDSRWWHSEGAKTHYGIKNGVDLAQTYSKSEDRRSFSGRILILPQPSFSIETKITQLLFDTLPSQLNEYLPQKERCKLVENLHKLQFLSAPLSGFNGHLQTVEQGNHVKPSIRDPKEGTMEFLREAQRPDAGFKGKQMASMGIETDVTPYGAAKKSISGPDGPSSFKPVIHGQFRLNRVNIVDKFGQVVHLLDPTPVPDNAPPEEVPRAWPCLSDWYSPGFKVKKGGRLLPNTVEDALDEADPKCEFVQVPPQINQSARINACWAVPAEPTAKTASSESPVAADKPKFRKPFWRAAHDWDSPIWGWVVVNYANYGLQFFLPSGAFYREVRLGGPNGALTSPDWLPFQEPDDPDGTDRGGPVDGGVAARQLARLVQTVATTEGYLQPFMAMLSAASASTGTAAPSAYSEFKSALIGKPLALVNMGWSLELAVPQQESQLVGDGPVRKKLYKSTATRATPGPGCERDEAYDASFYRFPVKLGDRERGFDGLVGYFKPLSALKPGDALDLDSIYTHFSPQTVLFDVELNKMAKSVGTSKASPVEQISQENYPRLPPHYIDPLGPDGDHISIDDFDDIANEQLNVFGAIVDPFSPVHAYSAILPVKELVLPNWTWQSALDKISAFFHIGPVLVTSDVPDFIESRRLVQGKLPPKLVAKQKGETGVLLPGGSLGQWTWLQPYMDEGANATVEKHASNTSGGGGGGGDHGQLEKFMPLAVDPVDGTSRLERGPYTALEGYLQMASGAAD